MKAKLLTMNQTKINKGIASGYLTGILHLTAGGKDICPWATVLCTNGCLDVSGHSAIPNDLAPGFRNSIERARHMRTEMWRKDRARFETLLYEDLVRVYTWAKQRGLQPAIRLNGTSDLLWERLTPWIYSDNYKFDRIQFYDYTKAPPLARRRLPTNYHLTQSWHEKATDKYLEDTISMGRSMAVVFATKRGQPLPATWRGVPVIDGDLHDLRFLDPPGVIVGLRAKGRMTKGDWKGFVQPV